MKQNICIALALATAPLALLTAAASAADYDPPIFVEEAPEYVPVEIGSGWYIRGDVTYTSDRSYKDTSARLTPGLSNVALLTLEPGTPFSLFSFSEKQQPISGSVGAGYHVNDYLRLEANLGILYADKYSGSGFVGRENSYFQNPAASLGCNGTYSKTETTETTTRGFDDNGDPTETTSTSVTTDESRAREGCNASATLRDSAWNGTVNAYVDLGTYAGFTPYVGVGGGLLYTRSKASVTAECKGKKRTNKGPMTGPDANGTTSQTTIDEAFLCDGSPDSATYNVASYRKSDFDFLYTLNAGVAYQVSDNTKIDLGYQYIDAPDVKGFKYHQIKVGLRYDLW